MIRVAIDARRLQDSPLRGVGRGLANVLPFLVPQVDVVLLFDRRRPVPTFEGCESVGLSGLGSLPETAWLQVSVASWLRRQDVVFHGPFYAVPAAFRGPSVVTLHDLSWEHHPEDFRSRTMRAVFRTQARWSARHSEVVVTDSEFIRQGLLSSYRLAPQKVRVAHMGVDPVFVAREPSHRPEVLARAGVHGRYVVALGGARRRGLAVSVQAWQQATAGAADRPSLVIVGPERPPLLDGVAYLGQVDDQTWAEVLAGADAFCYPTRYEGFGMPGLEAAACGVPVVCARVGPLPEVLGDAAQWCASPGADDIAAGLRQVLNDEPRRLALRAAGIDRARAAPTWRDNAAVLVDAYRTAKDNA